MGRHRAAAAGRRRELAALDEAWGDGTGIGRLALLRGPAGVGKSVLLDAAVAGWRARGVPVLTVRGAADVADPSGFRAVVQAVRDQFEHLGSPRLARAISRVSDACAGGPAAADPVRCALELRALFDVAADGRPAVLAVDDAGLLPAPLALDAAVQAGYLVVAACRDDGSPATVRLRAAADLVVDVGDLPEDAIAAVVARAAGAPADTALLAALRTALGPLGGHPGTVAATVAELRHCGRLVVRRGEGGGRARERLCVVDPAAPIALPADHHLVAAVHAVGPLAVRLTVMAAAIRFGIADLPLLAGATRDDTDRYGRVVDRLLTAGVLDADADGALTVRCPALATRLSREFQPSALARLHRACAAAILRQVGHGDPGDRAALADHVTSAGGSIPPDPRTAVHLYDIAAEAAAREPDRAARWLRAALWHAGDAPNTGRIAARLLRLLVQTGQYRRLAEVVDVVAANDAIVADPWHREDLAVAAMLAAVHTGVPVPAPTARALRRDVPAGPAALEFCARWFAMAGQPAVVGPERHPGPPGMRERTVEPLLTSAELARVASAIWTDDGPPLPDPVLFAGAAGDLATVLRLVVGDRYGLPDEGPLAAYRRLLAAYAAGDFTAALADARGLELSATSPVRHLAQVLAAELLALRGDGRGAADRLAAVPDTPPYQAVRWSARYATAPGSAADGWHAYQRQRASGCRLGVEGALVRLAELAVRSGRRETADAVLAEVGADGPRRVQVSTETALLVRAAVRGDHDAARAGADLARVRGHRPDLLRACLLAGAVADDPEPWLSEAYETARPFGSAWLRGRIAGMMRERGISTPRARPVASPFSPVERRIVELVRRGHTNRQIAARVQLSEKTVENHLTRLFARTGCRSRAELAAASLRGPWVGAAS